MQNYQFGAVYSGAKNIGNIVFDQIYHPVQNCGEMKLLSLFLPLSKIMINDILINFTQLDKNMRKLLLW